MTVGEEYVTWHMSWMTDMPRPLLIPTGFIIHKLLELMLELELELELELDSFLFVLSRSVLALLAMDVNADMNAVNSFGSTYVKGMMFQT